MGAPARQTMGLCQRRDFEITKLPSVVQREDFIVWRDQLEELLEQTPGWSGVGLVLERSESATLKRRLQRSEVQMNRQEISTRC